MNTYRQHRYWSKILTEHSNKYKIYNSKWLDDCTLRSNYSRHRRLWMWLLMSAPLYNNTGTAALNYIFVGSSLTSSPGFFSEVTSLTTRASLGLTAGLWHPILTVAVYGYNLPYTLGIKPPVPDRVKPSFVIFDIRALWRSALSVRVHWCQKLQMTA